MLTMLDKNGIPLQFPPSAFSAVPSGAVPPTWPPTQPPTQPQVPQIPPLPSANSAAAAQIPLSVPSSLVGHPHHPNSVASAALAQGLAESALLAGAAAGAPSISPTYLNSLHHAHLTHPLSPTASLQRLHAMHAAAQAQSELQQALQDPLAARATRKRSATSPYGDHLDLGTLLRFSPTASLAFINGAAAVAAASNPGSPSNSSDSFSQGALTPSAAALSLQNAAAAAAAQTHIQALIRSASTSPFLISPQNSFTNLQAAAAQTSPIPSLHQLALNDTNEAKREKSSENVVSSTIEDEDSKDSVKREYTSLDPPMKPTSSCSPKTAPSTKNPNHLAASGAASGAMHIKDEPDADFVETHCHWTGCDREFYTQDQLVKHLNNDHIGSNKKSFVCQWKDCSREEKPFKAQYMLVVHMRRHTGEKPHRCTFENCTKAYSRLENLKTHLRSHTGEKPYTCEFPGCTKAFSNASDRAKHQNRTHSNEKPYACKAPNCTKRYTDPSSLRKHVKTVHGAEFYASKRHKGNDYDGNNGGNNNGNGMKERANSVVKSEHDQQSSPSSNNSVGGGGGGGGNGISTTTGNNNSSSSTSSNMQMSSLPISDCNITTTNGGTRVMQQQQQQQSVLPALQTTAVAAPVYCADLDEPDDINMAVAAAIGVGSESSSSTAPSAIVSSSSSSAVAPRISHKMRMQNQQLQQQDLIQNHQPVMGEINKSIEKMSLGTTTLPQQQQQQQFRRDSDWTNSTEGYGSMRSNLNSTVNTTSRRCSELSGMSQSSNFSTRAVRNWTNNETSRRSSMAESGCGVSQQLSRLHQKAMDSQQQQQQQQQQMSDCHSVMSECISVGSNPQPPPPPAYNNVQMNGGMSRRASDPVRALDRNFGVSRQQQPQHPQQQQQQQPQQGLRRHGSFNQVNCDRIPIHGQNIRQNNFNGPTNFQQWANPQQQQQFNGFWPPSQQQQQQWGGNNQQQWYWNGQQQQPQRLPENSADSYTRTFEYVEQCRSWQQRSANGN